MVPQCILPVDAMDNHLHLAELLSPGTKIPYDHLLVVIHPDKAFVKQLLVCGCSIGYHRPQFAVNTKHLSLALQQANIIDKNLKKRQKQDTSLDHFIATVLHHYPSNGALDLGLCQNTTTID